MSERARPGSTLARSATWLALAALASAPAGCIAETLEPEVGEVRAGLCQPDDSDPERDVSFMEQIQPMLERPFGQGGCGCHQPTGRRASGIELTGLRLGGYADLMRGGDKSGDTIVVPGDPCASLVLQKTSNAPPSGARMPSDGPPYLSPREHALLHDWIAEGARDN
ncbi:MAG TPA: hypothetical protein VK509_20700 [Polyangiales bacterium]|nr:hypothetical protein [Polyangiales bacterium]